MTRKDPSPVDLETAEHDVDTPMSRRSLVTRTGAAGLAGLAAALLVDRTALASVDVPAGERPNVPTASDIDTLTQVIGVELAASSLYQARLDAGTDDDLAMVVRVMAGNHRAFAQAIAGATGVAAGDPDAEFVDTHSPGFTGSTDEFFTAAHTLEQTLAATHSDLIGGYQSSHAIDLTASIAVTEARQATVLADLLGTSDLDVVFGNTESPLSLGGNL